MDEGGYVTTREFDNATRDIREMIFEGFRGVNSRLDLINGRIGKQDGEIAVLHERQQEHQRHTDATNMIFMHRRSDDPAPPKPEGDNEAITYKDLKRALLIASAVATLAGGLIVTLLLKATGGH